MGRQTYTTFQVDVGTYLANDNALYKVVDRIASVGGTTYCKYKLSRHPGYSERNTLWLNWSEIQYHRLKPVPSEDLEIYLLRYT